MTRPRLLDLFCCAGGASAGYHAAGFDVTGVDIEPQPHYPFPFIRADALTVDLDGYDVIAASPPCQRYCCATPADRRDDHPDLVAPIRERLRQAVATGTAWAYVIENVPGAPLLDPIRLCGDTLRLGVRRHRLFESNVPLRGTDCHHDRDAPAVPVYGTHGQRTRRKPRGQGRKPRGHVDQETSPHGGAEGGRTAMGIDWMPWDNLTQAIPPAYTTWIGTQLLIHPDRPATVTEATRTQTSPHRTGPLTDATGGLRHCHCGTALTRPATGRWPRHCSPACRQRAYRARSKEAS
ncbi:DNA cytosine methyltransferase [Actinosynnema pretiosum]|uniref:DNA cytosine methyltransferase n=1 Tax=Actinosynnema pretiosum TaxID=42197 RepID=UPI000A431073|nr:DNA cytosine methyltransferase [Actinosynnema pretiosum]